MDRDRIGLIVDGRDFSMSTSREQAISALETLVTSGGLSLTDDDLVILQINVEEADKHKNRLLEISKAMYYGFFHCAAEGVVLIPETEVTKKFGHSIEENYPEANKVFLDFAKTYWTLQLLAFNLPRNNREWICTYLLVNLEQTIGPVFFPFPGNVQISPSKREKTQREIIGKRGAKIDIEKFIEGNPILIRDRSVVSKGSWKILLLPVSGLSFAVMAAIPGALTGLITGLFGFHIIAAIVGGIFFFIIYPAQRRRKGLQVDSLTYFNALFGAVGGGFACYLVGSLLQ